MNGRLARLVSPLQGWDWGWATRVPGRSTYSICVVKVFGVRDSGLWTVAQPSRCHKYGRGRDIRRDHGRVFPAETRTYDIDRISWVAPGLVCLAPSGPRRSAQGRHQFEGTEREFPISSQRSDAVVTGEETRHGPRTLSEKRGRLYHGEGHEFGIHALRAEQTSRIEPESAALQSIICVNFIFIERSCSINPRIGSLVGIACGRGLGRAVLPTPPNTDGGFAIGQAAENAPNGGESRGDRANLRPGVTRIRRRRPSPNPSGRARWIADSGFSGSPELRAKRPRFRAWLLIIRTVCPICSQS